MPPKSIQIGRLGVTMSDEPDGRRARGMGLKLAYDTIRDEILSLKLPPGQLLDETTLADRFGMSRSPIREALIRQDDALGTRARH